MKPWFLANPGLFTIGALLSLAITAYIIILTLRVAAIGPAYTAHVEARALISMGTAALISGGLAFSLVWLLSAVYRLTEFSLGFLSVHQGKHQRPILDDTTIVTGLSPYEILVAAGLHILRIITAPLVVFSGLVTIAFAGLTINSGGVLLTNLGDWTGVADITPVVVWWLLGCFIRLIVHGLIAGLAMGYFCLSLGLVRHPLWPLIGGVIHVVVQVIWLLLGVAMLHSYYVLNRQVDSNGPVVSLCAGLLGIATLILLVYIVLQVPVMRRAPVLVPVLLILAVTGSLAAMTFLEFSSLPFTFSMIRPVFNWAGQALAVADLLQCVPDQLAIGTSHCQDDSGQARMLFEWWRMPFMALFQVLYLLVLAEFARQVVIQRLSGEGGA